MLIYLHGVSSSGKSTIANALVNKLPNAMVIDQDSFYKKIKPTVTFKGDQMYTTTNWDTVESIDFNQLNDTITKALNCYHYVIVTGFALRDQYVIKPNLSILLDIGGNPIKKIALARQVSKGYRGKKDWYMVEEVVYPYYLETLQHITIDYKISVYDGEKRIPLTNLVDAIEKMIQ